MGSRDSFDHSYHLLPSSNINNNINIYNNNNSSSSSSGNEPPVNSRGVSGGASTSNSSKKSNSKSSNSSSSSGAAASSLLNAPLAQRRIQNSQLRLNDAIIDPVSHAPLQKDAVKSKIEEVNRAYQLEQQQEQQQQQQQQQQQKETLRVGSPEG
jgi:hypothetical protein